MTDHTALVERLRTVEFDDHERGCQMRCCACTCGFDDAAVLAAKEAALAIESLQAELVKTREQAEKMAEAASGAMLVLDGFPMSGINATKRTEALRQTLTAWRAQK